MSEQEKLETEISQASSKRASKEDASESEMAGQGEIVDVGEEKTDEIIQDSGQDIKDATEGEENVTEEVAKDADAENESEIKEAEPVSETGEAAAEDASEAPAEDNTELQQKEGTEPAESVPNEAEALPSESPDFHEIIDEASAEDTASIKYEVEKEKQTEEDQDQEPHPLDELTDQQADLPSGSNHSEDLELWPWDDDSPPRIPLDPAEGGFLSFVPPPPRPMFLEDVTPDGVTTCDLCSWAWQGGNALTYEGRETSSELGWVLTLVIVSLSSALIGAVIMIIVLHCKSRKKNSSVSETECGISLHQRISPRPPLHPPGDKEISTITPPTFPSIPVAPNVNGVWSWLARRSGTPPSNLNNSPGSHVENHYTHMEDQYNVEEALYAELDRETSDREDRDSNSPAYQNSAYTDTDAPTSSAPSSAYYSDLSVTTMPERAYEVVGLSPVSTMPAWDQCAPSAEVRRPTLRLAAISENVSTIPSDYV